MDSPYRQPVPRFGAWSSFEPGSPAIDYTEIFARARASRLGSIPADHFTDDYRPSDMPSYESESSSSSSSSPRTLSTLVRYPSGKKLLQYFVCGARTETMA